MPQDHWWISPSGLSKRDKDKLREATRSGREGRRERRKQNPVMPDQYIGRGAQAKRAAEEIAKELKGAKVYKSGFGSSSVNQTLWTRLANGIIDRIFKGKK